MKNTFLLLATIFMISNLARSQSSESEIPFSLSLISYNMDGFGLKIGTKKTLTGKYSIESNLTFCYRNSYDQHLVLTGYLNRQFNYQSGYVPRIGIGFGLMNTWMDDNSVEYTTRENSNGELRIVSALKVTPLSWDYRIKNGIPIQLNLDFVFLTRLDDLKTLDTYLLIQLGGTYYFNHEIEK